ncbi:RF-1 domain-containing protein [Cladochytrium replicatum]|nr:RF-1 domain-containing protein [Cladochytrium replicatum]
MMSSLIIRAVHLTNGLARRSLLATGWMCSSHTTAFASSSSSGSNPNQSSAKFDNSENTPQKIKISLDEGDLEEKFVRGSGPGGQKINTRSICVQLVHKPTGLSVETHRFRELFANRHEARKLLKEKLDEHFNGALSKKQIAIAKARKRKAKQKSRHAKDNDDSGVDSGGDQPGEAKDDE